MTSGPCILIWLYPDAPEALQRLTEPRGHEDYVAYFPPSLVQAIAPLLADTSWFGWYATSQHRQSDGSLVLIGAHA